MSQIAHVEAFEVILPLPKPLQLGAMVIPHREYTVVRVRDDQGEVGTAYHLSRNAPVAATVLKTVAPHWLGHALTDHSARYTHTLKANVTLGSNGIFWRAVSLFDCALHDLLARRAGVSLARYLGGTPRPIQPMLVGGYPLPSETPESLADEMRRYAAYKPSAIKLGSSVDWARDTQRLRTARGVIPDDIPLMLDLYWSLTDLAPFLAEAQAWGELGMGWIEDPVAYDDYDGLAQLAAALPYPVAVGDEQSGLRQFEHLMDRGHIGVVRLDATVCGGVRAFMAIARAAALRGLSVSAHVHPHLHTQLACALPNVRWVEYMPLEGGLESAHLLWQHDIGFVNGMLQTSDTPGIGYAWDEGALREARRRTEAR